MSKQRWKKSSLSCNSWIDKAEASISNLPFRAAYSSLWRWRQLAPPQRRKISIRLIDASFQKTTTFNFTFNFVTDNKKTEDLSNETRSKWDHSTSYCPTRKIKHKGTVSLRQKKLYSIIILSWTKLRKPNNNTRTSANGTRFKATAHTIIGITSESNSQCTTHSSRCPNTACLYWLSVKGRL